MDIWEIFNLKIKKIFEIGPILPWFCPWIYEKVFTSLLRIKKFQKNSRFSLCFVHGYIERSFEKYPFSVMYKQAGFHYHDKEDFMNNKNKRRKELLQFIRRRSGRRFLVAIMAKKFGVSKRTIQDDLACLELFGQIKRTPSYNSLHRQNGNIIVYTGSRRRQSHKSDDG